jgi:hypothetical protein
VQALAPPLAALVLAGCVFSHPEYPTGWAPLETPDRGCVSISGTYEDEGEPKIAAFPASPLHNFLFPRNTRMGGANKVVIAYSAAGIIEIVAWYNDEVVTATRQLSASANDYQCRDGAVELTMRDFVGGGQAAGMETNTIRLLKSVDGALVVKHTSSAFGLCVIVPCGGSEDKWYRFKPSKGDAGQAPGRTSGRTYSTGSERTPWHAVQRAAWGALSRAYRP